MRVHELSMLLCQILRLLNHTLIFAPLHTFRQGDVQSASLVGVDVLQQRAIYVDFSLQHHLLFPHCRYTLT